MAFQGDGVTVFLEGKPPTEVDQAISAARNIGPVEVQQARYSEAELQMAAQRIMDAAGTSSDIVSISSDGDGQGLEIGKLVNDASRASPRQVVRSAEQIVESVASGMPVIFTPAATPVEFASCANNICSRLDDSSPWNSGTFIARNGTYLCSSGFAVHKPWPQAGYLVLTAAHCGSAGDYFIDYAGEYIGTMGLDDWSHDVGTINASGWYWMWDGPVTTTTHKTVHSWDYPVDGEYVCQSGYHGTVCNMQTLIGATYSVLGCDSDNDCFWIYNLKKVIKMDNGDAAQPGDSGGPVFTLDGNGVRAKGLVTARSKTSAGNPYYDLMYYQDMVDIYDNHGLEPRTG